jgi:ABC-type multidrug transport system fused ATPase/permease subunit
LKQKTWSKRLYKKDSKIALLLQSHIELIQFYIAISINIYIKIIKNSIRILVVDKGGVKEFGSTKDLLNDKNSTFYAIFLEV